MHVLAFSILVLAAVIVMVVTAVAVVAWGHPLVVGPLPVPAPHARPDGVVAVLPGSSWGGGGPTFSLTSPRHGCSTWTESCECFHMAHGEMLIRRGTTSVTFARGESTVRPARGLVSSFPRQVRPADQRMSRKGGRGETTMTAAFTTSGGSHSMHHRSIRVLHAVRMPHLDAPGYSLNRRRHRRRTARTRTQRSRPPAPA